MRRSAVLEGAVERAEPLLHHVRAEPGDAERLDHQLGVVVADAARADLEAVADEIVLVGLDGERIARQRLHPALRHGEGVVAELDLARVAVTLVEREVGDPAQLEPVAVDQVQLLADADARVAGEGGELLGIAGGEEHRVAAAKT